MSKNIKKVEQKAFILAWQSSENVAEVAQKTGLTTASCATKAHIYRKKYGLNLKKLGSKGHKSPEDTKEMLRKYLEEVNAALPNNNSVDITGVLEPEQPLNTIIEDVEEITAVG